MKRVGEVVGVLETFLDPRAKSYLEARAATLAGLAELDAALRAAREGGGERLATRHHARGKLLAQERVELLVDRDTPLLELCSTAGWGAGGPIWDRVRAADAVPDRMHRTSHHPVSTGPIGAGLVTAIGVVEDRLTVIVASDPTVPGGAAGPEPVRKLRRALQVARQNRLPMIWLVEADPPTEPADAVQLGQLLAGFARLAGIPTVGVFLGDSAGLAGIDLAPVFDQIVVRSGLAATRPVDHVAADDRDALRLARRCALHFTRSNQDHSPAAPPKHDPEDLLAVPATAPREILGRVLDASELDEYQPGYAPAVCAGWARLHGRPVAVLADTGDSPGEAESGKAVRLLRRAASTRTPVVFLRHGSAVPGLEAAVAATVAATALPVVTVRVGDWSGVSTVDRLARFRFAWPTAALAGEPALRLSGRLADDGVIDPRDTRTVLALCLKAVEGTSARRVSTLPAAPIGPS